MRSGGLKSLIAEPLVHFLLAGAAIFVFSAWRGDPADPASRTITIDEARVSRLAASFAQTWRRAPRPDEIDALIREAIKDEIYAREALRLGLDQDDPVIRRRLRQKMEFLATSAVDTARPDEATLAAWLAKHPERFAEDADYSFDQIYLGEALPDVEAVRRALATDPGWQKMGKPFSLPASFETVAFDRIAADFGDDFAKMLATSSRNSWTGPVASGFGWHMVRVREASEPAAPRLADVRQKVENDWRAETRTARLADAYQTLLDSYTIRIDRP